MNLSSLHVHFILWTIVIFISIISINYCIVNDYPSFFIPIFFPLLYYLSMHDTIDSFMNDGDWFNLKNIHLAGFFVFLVLGSIYYLISINNQPSFFVFDYRIANTGILYVLLGVVTYKVTYNVFDTELHLQVDDKKIHFPSLAILAAISFLIKIYLSFQENALTFSLPDFDRIINNDISRINNYLTYFSYFNYYVIAVLSFLFFQNKLPKKLINFFYFIIILSIFFGFLVGKKEELLRLAFFIMVPFSLLKVSKMNKFNLSKKVFLGFAVLVLFAFIVNPIIRFGLSIFSGLDFEIALAVLNAGSSSIITSSFGSVGLEDSSLFNLSLQYMANRVFLFNLLLPAIYYTPDFIPFMNFEKYIYLIPFAFIPRLFWNEKPIILENIDYTYNYINGQLNSATSPSYIGWGYLEYGVLGIIVTMTLFALISVFVNKYLFQYIRNPVLIATFSSGLFFHLWSVMGYFFGMIAGLPTVFVNTFIFYFGYRIISFFLKYKL